MKKLEKLKTGDKVAILSPSFAAPGRWPHVHQLGLKRLTEVFGLVPVEYPTTRKLGASGQERSQDLIAAFSDKQIKAVITSIGGDDQVTYVKNLPSEPFIKNPKPFFGYSDNTHLANFLWLHDIPSYYGGALFTQFAQLGEIDPFTLEYLKLALFESRSVKLSASDSFSDIGLDWQDPTNLNKKRQYEPNEGWIWDGDQKTTGTSWGGCIESIDELLRHATAIPTLEQFKEIVLIAETSEEIPPHDYVFRVFRALGERGILTNLQGVLVSRPKGWEFGKERSAKERRNYRQDQRETILKAVRIYNPKIPVVQNLDFGHTEPQIPIPYGRTVSINPKDKIITVAF